MACPLTAPPPLRQLQEWMADCIVAPSSSAEPSDVGRPLDAWLYVPLAARLDDRLGVYRDGYPARVAESLKETYPAVAHLLGDRAFAALADRYVAAVPLRSYNLNDAGAALPAFLGDDPAAAARPFLPDLAQLEWRVAAAFHAVDGEPLDPRSLPWTVDDWAEAVLEFQPSVSLVTSRWALLDLWPARRDASDPLGEIARQEQAQHVVVRRNGLTVRCELVSADEAGAIRLLLAGERLGDAVESLAAEGAAASHVANWFSRWTGCGMLAAARHLER